MKINWENLYPKMNISKNKYTYYDGSFTYNDFINSSKVASRIAMSRVGWGRRAVEMRANKTQFDRFDNDTLGLNEVFNEFHGREAFNKIKDDTLICGVGFLALAGDRVMPFTALEATGTYDWHEQNLKNGVAIFQESTKKGTNTKYSEPDSYIYFDGNEIITKDGEDTIEETSNNPTGRPLITMLTHKSTTHQPFGRSVISKTSRNAIVDASRTVRQAMIAAYHYNIKVDVILGADNETSVDKVQAKAGDILKVGPNENGQIPQIGEFAQHAMAPFNDTILTSARNFCSDTKLSLANLGIATNAPQSPEALEIVGDDLRDDITEWQREMGEQLKYFAVTLWMYKNNISEIDQNLRQKIDAIEVAWMPVFRTDVSKFGDGLNKIAQIAPGALKSRSIWRNLGLTSSEIDQAIASTSENENIL